MDSHRRSASEGWFEWVAVWFPLSSSTFSKCRPYHCGQVVPSCDATCPFRRCFTQVWMWTVRGTRKKVRQVNPVNLVNLVNFVNFVLYWDSEKLSSFWWFELETFQSKDRDSLTDWQRAYDNRPSQRADSWLHDQLRQSCFVLDFSCPASADLWWLPWPTCIGMLVNALSKPTGRISKSRPCANRKWRILAKSWDVMSITEQVWTKSWATFHCLPLPPAKSLWHWHQTCLDLAIAGILSKTPAAKPHMDGLAPGESVQIVKRAQIHSNDFSTPRCVIRNPATGPTHDDPRPLPSTTTACVPRLNRW